MAIDYREHKAVSKNRPRKQPAGIFFFSLFVAVIIAYTLGLVTGWLVFRTAKRSSADSRTAPTDANMKGGDATEKSQTLPVEGTGGAAPEPQLTFYETLPKGNRDLMGSGLNSTRPPEQHPASVSPKPPAPAAKVVVLPETATQTREAAKSPARTADTPPAKESPTKDGTTREASVREDDANGRYVVQIASYHVRKEAEEFRDRLKASGMAAYIVESNIPEKGIFYRVRIGRKLNQKAAHEIAEKAGKGAIVIPE